MSMIRWSALSLVLGCGLFFGPTLPAQTVGGVAVDGSDRPVPGVVVLLLDTAARVAARSLTNERGEFRVTAARPGTYWLRTLRIGYRPTLTGPRAIASGADIAVRVVLSGLPITLDTVHTVARNVCRAFTDSASLTYVVWEQIRAALMAAELTATSRTIMATTVGYERTLDPDRNRVIRQTASVASGYVTRAWRTVPPDSLRRAGFVVTYPDNTVVYYAPGLDMLLSEGFVEDHCFRLTTGRDGTAGIAFEPTPERKRVAEIRGTLWLDRSSSELRRLEFRYANLRPEQEERSGGELEFTRLRDGKWVIARWNIRMPVLEQDVRGSIGGFRSETRVTAIQVAGGELALVRRGADTLWVRAPFVIAGSVHDSLSGAPIPGARVALLSTSVEAMSDQRGRVTLSGVLPGDYTLVIRTPSLDSVNTVHRIPVTIADSATPLDVRVPSGQLVLQVVCGQAAARTTTGGVVVGTARLRGDSTHRGGLVDLRIAAEWTSGATESAQRRRLEARATADGSFRLCGVPLNTQLALRAVADSAETAEPSLVRVAEATRLVHMALILDREADLAARGATFTGTVIADSSRSPIAGAEVALPEIGMATRTDSGGVFRIVGIPSGEHGVSIRRLGYGAADTRMLFTGHEIIERRVVLGRAVTLAPVTISERASERTMPGFEDNRHVGLGQFLTRGDLEKYTGMKFGTVLDQLHSIGTLRGSGDHLWVTSSRAPGTLCPPSRPVADAPPGTTCLEGHGYYVADAADRAHGIATACYSLVYIDGILMNGSREPTQPFDLNTIAPENVEAIEYYAGAAQTPVKYSRMGSNCGVLVIWTRRSS